jgi:hypothetical protein
MEKLGSDHWGGPRRGDEASDGLEEMRLEERGSRVGEELESEPYPNLGRGQIRDTVGLKPR